MNVSLFLLKSQFIHFKPLHHFCFLMLSKILKRHHVWTINCLHVFYEPINCWMQFFKYLYVSVFCLFVKYCSNLHFDCQVVPGDPQKFPIKACKPKRSHHSGAGGEKLHQHLDSWSNSVLYAIFMGLTFTKMLLYTLMESNYQNLYVVA